MFRVNCDHYKTILIAILLSLISLTHFSCNFQSSSIVDLSTKKIDFGNIIVGEKKKDTFIVSKFGTDTIEVEKIIITEKTPFSIAHETRKDIKNSKGEIRGGIKITVTFTPQELGTHTATITIKTNDAAEQNYFVLVKGKGINKQSDNVSTENPESKCLPCDNPPKNTCINSSSLQTYANPGNCWKQACIYEEILIVCENGCDIETAACKQNKCENVVCNDPINSCYKPVGICVDGRCDYEYENQKPCDDNNSCTENDICVNGECRGDTLLCNIPPNDCYQSHGQCVDGICNWEYKSDSSCNTGDSCAPLGKCELGKCVDPQPKICDVPPNSCYEALGICTIDKCQYTVKSEGSCDDNNVCTINDHCSDGNCIGDKVVCDLPPSPICTSAHTRLAFNKQGICDTQNGCQYISQEVTCQYGCNTSTGLCFGDSCEGVVCNNKPNECYSSSGACENGECVYTFLSQNSCNDNNLCTLNDQCLTDACSGSIKLCNVPPPNKCINTSTLRINENIGLCNESTGNCDYPYSDTICPFGCENDTCKADPCNNIVCNQPSHPCYKETGICVSGNCEYSFDNDKLCDDNQFCTEVDYCHNGLCAGTTRVCAQTEASVCINSTTLHIPISSSCNEQLDICEMQYTDYLCTFGCDQTTNSCAQNPCEGKICSTPPSPAGCYSPSGTCNSNTGECSYSFVSNISCNDNDPCTENDTCDGTTKQCKGYQVICDTPPPSSCTDNYTRRIYNPAGTCFDGSCTYSSTDILCDSDTLCVNGACVLACTTNPKVLVSQTTGIAESAKIAFDGANYGIVWQDNKSGVYQIYFRLLNQRAQFVTNEIRITNHTFDASKPELLWNESKQHYALVWQDKRHTVNNDDNWEIYFVKLDAQGQKIGNEIRLTNEVARSEKPSLVWNGSEYAVAWHDTRHSGQREIYFLRFGDTGSIVQPELRVTNANYDSVNVHLNWNDTQYLLMWADDRHRDTGSISETEVYTRVINNNGLMNGNENRMTNLLGTTSGGSVAFTPVENKYALLWSEKIGSDSYYKLFFNSADLLGVNSAIEQTVSNEDTSLSPDIQYLSISNEFLIVWGLKKQGSAIRNLHYATIDIEGFILHPITEISGGLSVSSIRSAVNKNQTSAMITYSYWVLSTRKDLYLSIICL